MAAEYKPEDKNQPKNQAKDVTKKVDDAPAATSGTKPEVSPKVQREMEAGKRALDRRKEEQDRAEEARKK